MLELVKQFGVTKLASIIGVTVAVLLALMLIIFSLAKPPMALLYSGMDYNDAGKVIEALDQSGVPYEIKGNGSMIFAPKDQVPKLRMDLAGNGLPAGNVVGYELFDKMDALGTTSFVQSINHLRALEGELARTISSLNTIRSARVHLVIPERTLFGQNKTKPSASIMIIGRQGPLSPQNVMAIQNLVASAVPDLMPDRVAIVDEAGELLTSPTSENNRAMIAGTIDNRTIEYQDRIRTQVQDLVERVVGEGKARVQVAAELDFNRVVEQSEIYDPDSQVARSHQTIEESESDSEGKKDEAVTIANNLPEQSQNDNSDGTTSASSSNRVEETINYEISKTQRTSTQEVGTVKRLSVAVVLDGTYTQGADGQKTWTPRTEEEMNQIRSLVKSAIGYSEIRGDTVEVVNLKFAQMEQPPLEEIKPPFLGLTKDDYLRIAEIVAAVIVGIILLLVIRIVLKGSGLLPANASPQMAGLPPQAGLQAQLAGPNMQLPGQQQAMIGQMPHNEALPAPAATPAAQAISNQIDLAQIEGQVKESSVKKIGELVGVHPDESVALIRTWMQES